MAVTGTSYSDWMRNNPEIVNQASNRMGGGSTQLAPISTPKAQPAPLPQAQPAPAPAQQATQANSIGSQLRNTQETPVNGAQPSEGSAMGQVNPPVDTGQHGMEGVTGIAKTIASIYTGGAAGAAMGAAGAGAQNRKTDNQGQQQGGNQSGGMMSMLGGLMGGMGGGK